MLFFFSSPRDSFFPFPSEELWCLLTKEERQCYNYQRDNQRKQSLSADFNNTGAKRPQSRRNAVFLALNTLVTSKKTAFPFLKVVDIYIYIYIYI